MIKKQFLVQEKQKYEIMANTFKSLDDVINLYCELHDRYPGIIAIVDGVRSPVSIYMLFTGREVRIGKNCARGLEYGPRPQAEGRTQDQGHSFSLYGPT